MKDMTVLDHFACAALAILPRATDEDLDYEFYKRTARLAYRLAVVMQEEKEIMDKPH